MVQLIKMDGLTIEKPSVLSANQWFCVLWWCLLKISSLGPQRTLAGQNSIRWWSWWRRPIKRMRNGIKELSWTPNWLEFHPLIFLQLREGWVLHLSESTVFGSSVSNEGKFTREVIYKQLIWLLISPVFLAFISLPFI